jgi:hypothetical protein
MASIRSSATRQHVEFIGNPTSNANKIKALGSNDGPVVLLEPDSLLASMLPEALNRHEFANKVAITMKDMLHLILGGLALHPEVNSGGAHFFVDASRLTKLFIDLEAAGYPSASFKGDKTKAMPKARKYIIEQILALPIEKRILVPADVIYEGARDNAETGTWYDWITCGDFGPGEGHERHEMLSQWVLLFPDDYFVKGSAHNESGRNGREFIETIEQIQSAASSKGRDISELPQKAQAAAIVAWFLRTRPPLNFVHYFTNASSEIERRCANSAAERFAPVFEKLWRVACPTLEGLWPHEVAEPITEACALASSLGVGGLSSGLTIEAVVTLETALKDIKAYAVGASNAERTAQVLRAYKNAENDKEKDHSTEARNLLQADSDFLDLKELLATIDIKEAGKIARVLLTHKHVAGIQFLNGKFSPCDFWKMRNGSKCESNLQAIFNEEVSVTTKGEHAEWGAILQEGTAKALLAGKIDRNWWLTLKPVIAKRDGMATFEKIDKRLRDRPASAIFADAEALLRIESTIKAIFKLLGFTGSDNNSFSKAFKTLMRMAGSIEGIPAGCPSIPGLKKRLMEVGTLLFRCAQDRFESMLVTPATVAKRVKDFILEDGPPLNALLALDETLDRILLDVEHGVYGLARGAHFNSTGGGDDAVESEAKKPKLEGKFDGGGETLLAKVWGLAAANHGITVDPTGTTYAWGSQIATYFQVAPDVANNCIACFAPSKHCAERNKWCPNPATCWERGGVGAHERVDGFPDDKCRAMPNDRFEAIDWNSMTSFHAKGGKGQQYGGRGQGRGGGFGQGRGIHKPHGKGRGKGGKGGKGGGGKGGKGGGGKGAGKGGAM